MELLQKNELKQVVGGPTLIELLTLLQSLEDLGLEVDDDVAFEFIQFALPLGDIISVEIKPPNGHDVNMVKITFADGTAKVMEHNFVGKLT